MSRSHWLNLGVFFASIGTFSCFAQEKAADEIPSEAAVAKPNSTQGSKEQATSTPLASQEIHHFLWLTQKRAQMALEDELPKLAIEKYLLIIDTLAQQAEANSSVPLSPEQLATIELGLLESFVRSGQFTDALALVEGTVTFTGHEAYKLYWQAQAQMGLQRWRGARDTLKSAEEFLDKEKQNTPQAQAHTALADWVALAQAQVMAVIARPETEIEAKIKPLLSSTNPALQDSAHNFALHYFFAQGRLAQVEELLTLQQNNMNALHPYKKQLWQARLAQKRAEHQQAIQKLQSLLNPQDEATDGTPEAEEAFNTTPTELPPTMQAQAVLSLAQSHQALGQLDQAQSLLLNQLTTRPNNPLFASQLLLLGDLPWSQSPQAQEVLQQWQQGATPSLRQGAAYLQGLRAETAQNWNLAKELFTPLWEEARTQGKSGKEFSLLAGLKLTQLRARAGDLQGALAILEELQKAYPEQTSKIAKGSFALFLRAQSSLQEGNKQDALELLEQIEGEQGALTTELAWNQALIFLSQPSTDQFMEAVELVQSGTNGIMLAQELRLNAIFEAVKRGDKQAILNLLEQFSLEQKQQNEAEKNATSAWPSALLLAGQWTLEQDPETLDFTRWQGWFSQLRPASNQLARELGQLQMRLALHAGEIQAAQQVFESLNASESNQEQFAPLRLELAQAQFSRGDFAGALLQYDLYLRVMPEGEGAHLARYAAAYATLQLPTQDALANAVQRLGTIIADENSPFRIEALLQQAYALQRLGELDTAAEVLDDALAQEWTKERRGELKNRLSELEFPLGEQARKRALDRWESLRQDTTLALSVREASAWNEAQAWETMDKPMKALALYREVILGFSQLEQPASQASNSNTYWFHACVKSAVALLEQQENWAAAAALLDRAATRLNGAEAENYRDQAERIRLRHFL